MFDPRSFPDSAPKDPAPAPLEREKPDVIIIVPPFADPRVPALGPSLLMEACLKRSIDCHIFYTNLLFAALVDHELYIKIAWRESSYKLFGEALFAPYAFGLNKDELIDLLFKTGPKEKGLSLEDYLECDRLIPAFLDHTVAKIINEKPAILGFSSVFEQNTASLAIASRIKEVSPKIIIVMGGSNVTYPMGKALLDIAPMIDYVFSGYADEEFPRFCVDFFYNESLPMSKIIDCTPIDDLDQVEIPNYTGYFQQLKGFQKEGLLPNGWPEKIPFESSRGCWWGAKCQCTFCGLNAVNLEYREKKKERITKEIIYLKNMYDINCLYAVDNVMPKDFGGVLNNIINLDEGFELFYEVRSNLKPSFLDALVKGGVVNLQPGIESLSSNILEKMRKGVTALQNICFLREGCSRQINLMWNILLGVPGETQDDYDHILSILPMIEHFQPPFTWGKIRLDRYSPYFNNPSRFGINNLKPLDTYNLIYPPEANLDELAHFFTGDYESIFSINAEMCKKITDQISRWVQLWQDTKKRPKLSRVQVLNGMQMIMDTRSVAKQTFTALDDESFELLNILNEPTRGKAIPDALRNWLPELLERYFVIFYEDHYISLFTDPLIGINLRKQKKSDDYNKAAPSSNWSTGLDALQTIVIND